MFTAKSPTPSSPKPQTSKLFGEKTLTLTYGINILGIVLPMISLMKNSINCLAAVVAIAVSESKKAVFATAVAIIGIGLLSAPVEQVQAQSSLPVVSEVILSDFDFFSSDWFTVEIDVEIPST